MKLTLHNSFFTEVTQPFISTNSCADGCLNEEVWESLPIVFQVAGRAKILFLASSALVVSSGGVFKIALVRRQSCPAIALLILSLFTFVHFDPSHSAPFGFFNVSKTLQWMKDSSSAHVHLENCCNVADDKSGIFVHSCNSVKAWL